MMERMSVFIPTFRICLPFARSLRLRGDMAHADIEDLVQDEGTGPEIVPEYVPDPSLVWYMFRETGPKD